MFRQYQGFARTDVYQSHDIVYLTRYLDIRFLSRTDLNITTSQVYGSTSTSINLQRLDATRRAALTVLYILYLSIHRIFCFISQRMSSPAPPATATTPPDRSKGTPLTPPPTEEKSRRTPIVQIRDEVRRRRLQQGQYSFPPWQRFPLREDEYTDLLAEVGKESVSVQEFWTHKLR